jgi:carboxymethylenebutenolidase
MRRSILALALAAFTLAAFTLAACGDSSDDYGEAMSREHADDSPTSNVHDAVPADADIVTEEVVYATVDGAAVTGYLARPDTAGTLPGLIVIHEWWGLNDNIRTSAERLAAEGYVALAVDLYGGDVAETPDRARTLMSGAMERQDALTTNLTQAYDYLTLQRNADAVGSIGWCFGGAWSLRTALALPDRLDAAVIYYGQLVTDPDRLATLDMPILGIFGAEDGSIPLDAVRDFGDTLDSLGTDVTIEVYDGAGHAFANPSGERYLPEAAADAWRTTLDFLDRTLRGNADGSSM